ncbi:hypothetical protein ALNOE001_01270 [Candidatus Methanobinarius endosymbioticus]|uniref:Right handed beta helix domain-containing protein n=1 Tax=Candidatus Methanobinarius endosymbioticus TaxID=2006182 RepID=A0A366MFM2_9EURY|nr:hypothetical protein ALNOE001_01270 [Candidatus Methanobinarius endosymbioticus]
MINSSFNDNNASDLVFGEAIYNTGSNFTITNNNFSDNNAGSCGGVIYNLSSYFSVVNSTFTDNLINLSDT